MQLEDLLALVTSGRTAGLGSLHSRQGSRLFNRPWSVLPAPQTTTLSPTHTMAYCPSPNKTPGNLMLMLVQGRPTPCAQTAPSLQGEAVPHIGYKEPRTQCVLSHPVSPGVPAMKGPSEKTLPVQPGLGQEPYSTPAKPTEHSSLEPRRASCTLSP